mmetsp:Transcript_54660/g.114257  ORF Transcript_54660/g.114257 Transcript_54660/m.114257 type:complete len:214 (+) Transcript_54660:1657-2298(+)
MHAAQGHAGLDAALEVAQRAIQEAQAGLGHRGEQVHVEQDEAAHAEDEEERRQPQDEQPQPRQRLGLRLHHCRRPRVDEVLLSGAVRRVGAVRRLLVAFAVLHHLHRVARLEDLGAVAVLAGAGLVVEHGLAKVRKVQVQRRAPRELGQQLLVALLRVGDGLRGLVEALDELLRHRYGCVALGAAGDLPQPLEQRDALLVLLADVGELGGDLH